MKDFYMYNNAHTVN